MIRTIAAAAITIAWATTACAQDTITITAADGFRFIRCVDMFGTASCEFIASGTDPMRCVALDAQGEPIATAPAFPSMSAASFVDVDAATIATMICS